MSTRPPRAPTGSRPTWSGRSAARAGRDGLSREFLLSLAEELQGDVAQLVRHEPERPIPTLGLSAQIELRDGHERTAFMAELQATRYKPWRRSTALATPRHQPSSQPPSG
ncbi:MAG: hypothetical protein U0232_31015 [Thermomicrobiales bacterium]